MRLAHLKLNLSFDSLKAFVYIWTTKKSVSSSGPQCVLRNHLIESLWDISRIRTKVLFMVNILFKKTDVMITDYQIICTNSINTLVKYRNIRAWEGRIIKIRPQYNIPSVQEVVAHFI